MLPSSETENKRKMKSFIVECIFYLVLLVLCIYAVPEYVIQRTVVKGASMENTLHTGESLLVEKVTKHFGNPNRFDIIVFSPHNFQDDELYVKRVIGLPGETVQIKEHKILINGQEIEDPYAKGETVESGIAAEPITLKEDEFFVLGDNRGISLDSRSSNLGPVKKESIAGKAVFRIWPVDKIGIP